jgi:hypothetical protein
MTKQAIWLGQTKCCNVCQGPFTTELFDAKLITGQWGTVCDGCFKTFGLGLGTGLGQKYAKRDNDIYVKVEG